MTETTGRDDLAVWLPGMRVSYEGTEFDEGDLAPTWTEQFEHWMAEATAGGVVEPNAMVLATVGRDGHPASRTVLCKDVSERGIAFYTNYTSAKSHDLKATPYASATFPWYLMHRQVHVRGPVERVSAAQTAEYWASRPRGSQLGAWASPQSSFVNDRRALENALRVVERRFADVDEIPPPPHWGGYRIRPDVVEFWQGREDRLHDRLRYVRHDDGWVTERLAP